jgi:hypothetical protein
MMIAWMASRTNVSLLLAFPGVVVSRDHGHRQRFNLSEVVSDEGKLIDLTKPAACRRDSGSEVNDAPRCLLAMKQFTTQGRLRPPVLGVIAALSVTSAMDAFGLSAFSALPLLVTAAAIAGGALRLGTEFGIAFVFVALAPGHGRSVRTLVVPKTAGIRWLQSSVSVSDDYLLAWSR